MKICDGPGKIDHISPKFGIYFVDEYYYSYALVAFLFTQTKHLKMDRFALQDGQFLALPNIAVTANSGAVKLGKGIIQA